MTTLCMCFAAACLLLLWACGRLLQQKEALKDELRLAYCVIAIDTVLMTTVERDEALHHEREKGDAP